MVYTKKGLFACSPSTQRGEPTVLDVNPKGDKFLYTNGRSVYIRDLENPSICDEYYEHLTTTTVARFSNNGNYVASGDISGMVRIWDVTQPEKILKLETRPLSSRINDISWDSESQRILAVGDGNQRFGHVFTYDSGNSTGEIIGHSKVITSCSMRPSGRPFRAVTASHDFTVKFYHGAPYRFVSSIADHTNSVNAVKYSPDGEHFVSVGADRKVFMYEGLDAEKKAEFSQGEGAHTGSIYGLSWADDSKSFATSAADCTVKLWDSETQQNIQTISMTLEENAVLNQQVGNLWKGNYLVSLSLSGTLNYIDPREGKVTKRVHGHNKGINRIEVLKNQNKETTFFSGDFDGKIFNWDLKTGEAKEVKGNSHSNKVNGLVINDDKVFSVGMDDTLRSISSDELCYNDGVIKTEAEPIDIISLGDSDYAIPTKDDHLKLVTSNQIHSSIKLPFTPSSIAYCAINSFIAIGSEGKGINIYKYNKEGKSLESIGSPIEDKLNVSVMKFDKSGKYFAIGQTNGKITLYDPTALPFKLITSRWSHHTARIYQLRFSPDSKFVASCSLDSNINIYSTEVIIKRASIINAHSSPVTDVQFIDYPENVESKQKVNIASVGTDGNLKLWEIELPA
ncbi:WD40 repeat-like protein [Neoconidiobolus thromboides FSU 785]|nr:WD40 repeat-like protein [Neoconidiobolus thromboides FSU 785]